MKILVAAIGLVTIGCGASPGSQTVSGRVAQQTFASPVDQVSVIKAGASVVAAPVAPDGAFTIVIPPGSGYRIELSSAATRAGLVSPRSTGTLDATFAIRGKAAPFDLGTVRYIGNPTTTIFKQTGGGTGDGDGECEDGIDPTTNAVCVDDNEEEGGSCQGDDGETNDDVEDGTPDGETDDDGIEDGTPDGETEDDGAPADAAVADHNLPNALGCDDGEQQDGEQDDGGADGESAD
jgi:hypothetical protein